MAEGAGRIAIAGAAAAAFVVGAAAGWLVARAGAGDAPPPPTLGNPLFDAKQGESLALRRADGTLFNYRVLEADLQTVLLLAETQAPGQPLGARQLRVSRTWFGSFLILEGDVQPEVSEASTRDFVLERVTPATWLPPALGRPLRCWRFHGRHRVVGPITVWTSDEVPVHGVVRIDGDKGTLFEYHGSHGGP